MAQPSYYREALRDLKPMTWKPRFSVNAEKWEERCEGPSRVNTLGRLVNQLLVLFGKKDTAN